MSKLNLKDKLEMSLVLTKTRDVSPAPSPKPKRNKSIYLQPGPALDKAIAAYRQHKARKEANGHS